MQAQGQSRRTLMAYRKTHTHKCACHSCAAKIGPGMLMCPKHWFALEARLREDIVNEIRNCKLANIAHSDRLIGLRDRAVAFHAKQPELLT